MHRAAKGLRSKIDRLKSLPTTRMRTIAVSINNLRGKGAIRSSLSIMGVHLIKLSHILIW